jgi:hypothetical protein
MNSKLTPPEFLGFTTSIIFVFVCGWLIWNAQQHLTPEWLFWLGFATLAPLVPVPALFVYSKIWAMFRVDTSGTKRQVSRARK